MSAYNAEKTIKRAIDSVLKQSLKDLELIIINDCSTDSTEDIILSYKDDRIKYIKHEINQGAGCARDTGIKNCSGEYIQFLDSDDYYQPGLLKRLSLEVDGCDVVRFQVQDAYSDGHVVKYCDNVF